MNLDFSYIGFIYLLMLTIPNLIWVKNKPKNYSTKKENKWLVLCERLGQSLVTVTVLIFTDFNLRPFSLWSLWLIISFILMLLYECWWIRYFKSEKNLRDFYSNFSVFPVAGATLPVSAFLLLGIYEKNIILIISVLLLGIGHIGIHLQHKKELTDA